MTIIRELPKIFPLVEQTNDELVFCCDAAY